MSEAPQVKRPGPGRPPKKIVPTAKLSLTQVILTPLDVRFKAPSLNSAGISEQVAYFSVISTFCDRFLRAEECFEVTGLSLEQGLDMISSMGLPGHGPCAALIQEQFEAFCLKSGIPFEAPKSQS